MILASHCTIALQVVAGILSILAPDYGEHLLLFMHPLNFEGRHLDFGFGEFLAVGGNGTQFRRLNSLVVICLSQITGWMQCGSTT